jgi:F-type H+-transporting ATPase subunit epsilon
MSANAIIFKIVTPEKTVFEDTVDQATLPVADGEVTILPSHRSYIAALKPGEIYLRKGKDDFSFSISGGFIEFADNNLVVLADTAERAEEIDVARAEAGRKRAEELKQQQISMDESEYARVAAAIEKETARLRVARKHHTKKGIRID